LVLLQEICHDARSRELQRLRGCLFFKFLLFYILQFFIKAVYQLPMVKAPVR